MTRWARRAVGILVAVVGSMIAAVWLGSAPASAHPVCETEVTDPQTGRVICIGERAHSHDDDGDDNSDSGGPESEADRWNRLCNIPRTGLGPYQPGWTVTVANQGQIPPENYDAVNDSRLPGDPFLEEGEIYFIVLITCQGAGGPVGYFVTQPGAPVVDLIALRDEAAAQITVPDPDIQLNPPAGSDSFGIVRIPTWFWVPPDRWQPLVGEASDGGITVRVEATPRVATWDPGDGSAPIECRGDPVPWQPGLPETATSCSHEYVSSSADQAGAVYSVSVTTEWVFTWFVDGAPQGEFGTATPSATVDYGVGEIQAVES